MPRSLKVAKQYRERAKLALKRNGYARQQDLAEALGFARSTVNNFLNGKPVDYLNFLEICEKLQLALDEIADFADEEIPDSTLTSTSVVPSIEKFSIEHLYEALLCLNYTKQEDRFAEFVREHPIGACLIHGEPEFGQEWLLNRLLKLLPVQMTTAFVHRTSFLRVTRSYSLESLWRELAVATGATSSSPTDVAKAVCNLWQSQSVILIFKDVDQLPGAEFLDEFIHKFWHPLAAEACKCSSQTLNDRLIAFLVDSQGRANDWSINCTEILDVNWEPLQLLKLPKITHITRFELAYWLEKQKDKLPQALTVQIEQAVIEILESREFGIPQLVLEAVCKRCGHNWYQSERVWLKF
ncbi:helix-turn-helix transcriptional regulator [Oscillatoria sp. FACHB-1407]|uniref:helix-turn-helix domain-containing protein n=1 Tax=Oscillatoria sp. FACHB-1407 TaxID=2692847 RepID=UPI0016879A0D|nr:helix-turn-helix domain-containing protein [Oscillatoria sp. FACHB-1407]MBD2463949.1 helix-turn-helix transcriptional regulator [Oscillatoria sp. FACHB-1407]